MQNNEETPLYYKQTISACNCHNQTTRFLIDAYNNSTGS